MALSRRKFSAEFKVRAVRQVEAGASTAVVARRYERRVLGLPAVAEIETKQDRMHQTVHFRGVRVQHSLAER